MLNAFQLKTMLKKTPKAYVRERPAKGGGTWKYVSGTYFRKVLNMMFGWDWDFEIKDKQVIFNQVIVEGRLTVRSGGTTIVKEQIGKKEIMFKRGTTDAMDIGNDFKAACTDALKKCAAELGIASDVYNASEFKEIELDMSEELTPHEKKLMEEKNRLIRLIKASRSSEELKQYEEYLNDDQEIMDIYNKKVKEVSNAK